MSRAKAIAALLALCGGFTAAHAGSRSSASYSIVTESFDAGGGKSASALYSTDASIGTVTGIATAAVPAVAAKNGYIGQLFEVTGLTLTAVALNVNEGTTDQLGAWLALDDASFLAVPAASVTWSVLSGPLTGLSAGGLATAGIVFQDTAATAQGVFSGNIGTLAMTVKNVNTDDYGTYAADGIDDAWQNQFFGLNTPNAAPTVDFDGTGQTNLFKYLAGLNPLDGSRFTLRIAPVAGQPGQKALVFSPRLTDRTYNVTARPALTTGSYVPLTNPSAPSDAGPQRTITDLSAGGAAKFYRVEITKP